MEEQQSKKHYHLIVAEIIFTANEQDVPNAVRINGVLVGDDKDLPSAQLGKAQQIAQMNFHQRMGEEMANVRIVDVVLYNFVYLGHMTQEEFAKPPAGMKVQERKDPELAVVSDEPVPDLDEVARAAAQNDAQ